jgi:hypothetical protein
MKKGRREVMKNLLGSVSLVTLLVSSASVALAQPPERVKVLIGFRVDPGFGGGAVERGGVVPPLPLVPAIAGDGAGDRPQRLRRSPRSRSLKPTAKSTPIAELDSV